MLLEIINKFSLDVLNFHPECEGKWTRTQAVGDEVVKSVIDYSITCKKLSTKIKSMKIDEEKLFCPFRLIKGEREKMKQQYSDHNALLTKFAVTFRGARNENRSSEVVGWNITDNGLKQFTELTSTKETSYLKNTDNYTELHEALTSMMDSCFHRKKKAKTFEENTIVDKGMRNVLKLLLPFLAKGKTEKTVAQKYIQYLKELQMSIVQEMRSTRLKKTLKNLQDNNNEFSVEKFWKLRKSITSKSEERTSIITAQGIEVSSSQAIIDEYKKEFIKRLSHRQIHPSMQKYEELSHHLLNLYLTVECMRKSEPDFSEKEVKSVLKTLKNGKASGPDMFPAEIFINAGPNLIQGIIGVANNIKNSVKTPDEWVNMTIKTLFKNKGSRKKLENHRGIFLTCVLSKVLEKLIQSRIEVHTDKINDLQSGSRKNKSTGDNIYIMNSIIDHALYLNTPLYITSYDYATCFDSLWLEDCLLSLWKLGVKNSMLPLIYELNKNSEIKVKTPVGTTTSFTSPTIVKQGTVLGPKLCCSSTGEICDDDNVGGASVGCTTVISSIYVDDCNRFTTNINDTIDCHSKFILFTMRKRLQLHPDKCVLMRINKITHESCPSLKIDDHCIKEVSETKILGDIFNNKGNNNSLIETRVKSIKGVIINIFAMCTEVTFGFHYLRVMVLLYKTVFIPSLIFNSQAWSNLTATNLQNLQTIQLKCLKRVMRTAPSTPNSSTFVELGVLPIKYEIQIRQLSFWHHILTLRTDDPVKLLYEEQKQYPYEKNWLSNNLVLRKMYDLPNEEEVKLMKYDQWKKIVKTKVRQKAHEELLADCDKKKKTHDLTFTQKFVTQPYILSYPAEVAIQIFRIRTKSTNCHSNRGSSNLCRLCQHEKEDQEHVVNCTKIREGGNILDISILQQEVPINSEEVKEIARRFKRFENIIKEL